MRYLLSLLLLSVLAGMYACNNQEKKPTETQAPTTETKPAVAPTITFPEGFSATVFADSLGKARHIVFHNGDLYVKLDNLNNGRGILRLRDTNNDGVADAISGFGNYTGTGITIKDGYL